MSRPRLIVGLLALALIIGFAVYLGTKTDTGTVPYHIARLDALLREERRSRNPSRFQDYLRLHTLQWYLRGRPTWISEWEQEQNALLDLGYFERREIVLTNRQLGAAAWSDVAVSNAFFGTNKTWFVHMDDQKPSWVRVTGTKLDNFERIIRSWDMQETK